MIEMRKGKAPIHIHPDMIREEETDDKTPCVLYTEEEVDHLIKQLTYQQFRNTKSRTKRGTMVDFRPRPQKWPQAVLTYKFDGSHGEINNYSKTLH